MSAYDLFSHVFAVGLVAILREEMHSPRPLGLRWVDPTALVVEPLGGGSLPIEEAAGATKDFISKLAQHLSTINCRVVVGGKSHSPLSPRITKAFAEGERNEYFAKRLSALDDMRAVSPLFVRLVNALGFPSYWSELSSIKALQGNLDISASTWEMAPRNSGSEFFVNKYVPFLEMLAGLGADEVACRLVGTVEDAAKADRNTCGLHRPGPTDVLRSWVAFHGLASFPTRPLTRGSCCSVAVGVLRPLPKQRGKTYFVVPVPCETVSLERYEAACRYAGLYELARSAVGDMRADGAGFAVEKTAHLPDGPGSARACMWLRAHGIGQVALFERYQGGSASCPEYFALEGHVLSI